MGNLNVAVLGPAGYAKDLGKKGTESDIIFYNLKKGGDTVTFIEPARYPERLAPLFYAASMADEALVVVSEITPIFGEWVLMLDEVGVERGSIILKNYLTPPDLAPLLRGTVLENYEFVDDDPIALRERLIARAHARRPVPPEPGATGTVAIDHHFNVRGIGTVILGGVVRGGIRKHDAMTVYPGERAVTVRSIQKHDDDFDWAAEGDRVGLALKNIEADDLDRGYVLSTDPAIRVGTELKARATLVRYWPAPTARRAWCSTSATGCSSYRRGSRRCRTTGTGEDRCLRLRLRKTLSASRVTGRCSTISRAGNSGSPGILNSHEQRQ